MSGMSASVESAASVGYSSDRMKERRRSVLSAARKLIAEHGLDGFSMRKLAQRAGVSAATLFNIYGNRENLVSQAVYDAFHASLDDDVSETPQSIEQLERYVDWTAEQVIDLGNYVAAIVACYFSRTPDNPIRAVLHREAMAPYAAYLQSVRKRGNLSLPPGDGALVDMMVNHVFCAMHAWSIGECTDAQLPAELKRGVFAIVVAISSGDDRVHAERLLAASTPA